MIAFSKIDHNHGVLLMRTALPWIIGAILVLAAVGFATGFFTRIFGG